MWWRTWASAQSVPSGPPPEVREAELWDRLTGQMGRVPALVWAESHVIGELGSRTVREALAAGEPCKDIWRAVWQNLELPPVDR